MTKTSLMEVSDGVFLDIASCGSSVRWGVEVEEHVSKTGQRSVSANTEVALTDCSRTITWSDSDYGDGALKTQLKKVDAALRTLSVYRSQLRRAHRLIEKHRKEHPQNDS